MTDDLVKRARNPVFGTETSERNLMTALADRIEALQAQNFRLSGMCHDLKKEVSISDALLISEAEASLERLARAEKAEADNARLREALADIVADCEATYPPSHGAIKYAARLALNTGKELSHE
jgi:hypothetical protein